MVVGHQVAVGRDDEAGAFPDLRVAPLLTVRVGPAGTEEPLPELFLAVRRLLVGTLLGLEKSRPPITMPKTILRPMTARRDTKLRPRLLMHRPPLGRTTVRCFGEPVRRLGG